MTYLRKLLFSAAFGASASFAAVAVSGTARADEPAASTAASTVPHPFAYGILVGTNFGGAGQQTLHYAEDDARKMADVLRQLGRYGSADLRVLVRPDGAQLLAAIDDVAVKMRAHQAKGEQAVLVFYYSGHARAGSFSLGGEELAVTTLREKLRQIPSTLTLVVLDACQSGQFARIKGAEAAADFSYNSVSRLTTKGIAVMASSSAQELSQESDELHSSYFTHHLIVALRGAGDADGDGRVSLDEAYRYAYRRTLAATAQTQVGGQHATLETDLAGQGDVAVTYPADAKSQLELPGALEARILVQQKPSGNVVAEVQKAKGAPLRLAFAAGSYEAIVRDASTIAAGRALRCKLSLSDDRVTALDLGACESVRITASGIKGDDEADDPVIVGGAPPSPDVVRPLPAPGRPVEPWAIEAGVGAMARVDDGFTRRLATFGYEQERGLFDPRVRASVALSKGLVPHVAVGILATTLSGDTYRRKLGDSDDRYHFDAYGAGVFVRFSTSFLDFRGDYRAAFDQVLTPHGLHIDVYLQLGGGVTLGTSNLSIGSSANGASESSSATDFGYMIGGAAGVALVTSGLFAFYIQPGADYAPTTKNLLGDVHDAGGFNVQTGLRFQLGN
jgi:hypothetical protein